MCWHGILTEDGTGILSQEPNPTGGTEDGTGILFEEPNPTGSRPSDLIGLCGIGVSFKVGQHTKPHPPQNTRKGKEDKVARNCKPDPQPLIASDPWQSLTQTPKPSRHRGDNLRIHVYHKA